MIGLTKNKFKNDDAHETIISSANLPRNLTPGKFRLVESESEINNFEILHPELEIMESHPENIESLFFWRILGHHQALSILIGTRIVGNESYKPPGAFHPLQDFQTSWEMQYFRDQTSRNIVKQLKQKHMKSPEHCPVGDFGVLNPNLRAKTLKSGTSTSK